MAYTEAQLHAITDNDRLQAWVADVAELTEPDDVYWCDGSDSEYDQLAQTLLPPNVS